MGRYEAVRIELADERRSPTRTGPEGGAQIVEEHSGSEWRLIETILPSYSYTTLDYDNQPQTFAGHSSLVTSLITRKRRAASGAERPRRDRLAPRSAHTIARSIAPGATGNQLVAYEDRPLNWDAWDIDIFYEEKPYPVHEIIDWRVTEEGPLRSAIRDHAARRAEHDHAAHPACGAIRGGSTS